MEKHIVTIEDVHISSETLLAALRIDEDDESMEQIESMRLEAQSIARPVALFAPARPDTRDGIITVNGVAFSEPFVYEMLAQQETVIPYVASCGQEIDMWSEQYTDFFAQFVADTIKQLCLFQARERLFIETRAYFGVGDISTLNPGSLPQWPITGQRPLFEALGGVTPDIGVRLTDSFLMLPTKSVSGIMFQAAEHYENCQLCPRKDCPNRRAPYVGD